MAFARGLASLAISDNISGSFGDEQAHVDVIHQHEKDGQSAKQIYADHYFETAVELTCIVDRNPGIYLLVLRRYRFDNLPGGILNIRGRAIGALRDQLTLDLRRQQTTGQ